MTPNQPITYVRIEVRRGDSSQTIELHGSATAPIDGAFAFTEDDRHGYVELRLRGRTDPADDAIG